MPALGSLALLDLLDLPLNAQIFLWGLLATAVIAGGNGLVSALLGRRAGTLPSQAQQLTELNSAVQAINTLNEGLNRDNARILAERAAYQQDVRTLRDEAAQRDRQIADLRETVEALQDQLAEVPGLTTALKKAREELRAALAERDELKARLGRAEERLAALDTELHP